MRSLIALTLLLATILSANTLLSTYSKGADVKLRFTPINNNNLSSQILGPKPDSQNAVWLIEQSPVSPSFVDTELSISDGFSTRVLKLTLEGQQFPFLLKKTTNVLLLRVVSEKLISLAYKSPIINELQVISGGAEISLFLR